MGFNPVVLAAPVDTEGKEIIWGPLPDAIISQLTLVLNYLVEQKLPARMLMRLTAKGNFICAAQSPTGNTKTKLYLDGEAFGIQDNNALDLPSGDDQAGGDFEMWFWIVS
jgi:hypothetical protein